MAANMLYGSQILLYSYGSGAVGCLFTIRGRRCSNPQFHLKNLAAKVRSPPVNHHIYSVQ